MMLNGLAEEVFGTKRVTEDVIALVLGLVLLTEYLLLLFTVGVSKEIYEAEVRLLRLLCLALVLMSLGLLRGGFWSVAQMKDGGVCMAALVIGSLGRTAANFLTAFSGLHALALQNMDTVLSAVVNKRWLHWLLLATCWLVAIVETLMIHIDQSSCKNHSRYSIILESALDMVAMSCLAFFVLAYAFRSRVRTRETMLSNSMPRGSIMCPDLHKARSVNAAFTLIVFGAVSSTLSLPSLIVSLIYFTYDEEPGLGPGVATTGFVLSGLWLCSNILLFPLLSYRHVCLRQQVKNMCCRKCLKNNEELFDYSIETNYDTVYQCHQRIRDPDVRARLSTYPEIRLSITHSMPVLLKTSVDYNPARSPHFEPRAARSDSV